MHSDIKKAQRTVNPQLAPGAFWMSAGLCRGRGAPRRGRGARRGGTRWLRRQSASSQQKLGDSLREPELVSSRGFHSMWLNAQFLGRLISSGTVPREFGAIGLGPWLHLG